QKRNLTNISKRNFSQESVFQNKSVSGSRRSPLEGPTFRSTPVRSPLRESSPASVRRTSITSIASSSSQGSANPSPIRKVNFQSTQIDIESTISQRSLDLTAISKNISSVPNRETPKSDKPQAEDT